MSRLTTCLNRQEEFYGKDENWVDEDERIWIRNVEDKLGQLEDLIDEMDSVRIVERDGISSLHIDMILTSETLPIVKEIFKDRLKENKEE